MGCLVSSIKEFKDRLKGNPEDSFIMVSKKTPKAAAWRRKMKTVKEKEKDARCLLGCHGVGHVNAGSLVEGRRTKC